MVHFAAENNADASPEVLIRFGLSLHIRDGLGDTALRTRRGNTSRLRLCPAGIVGSPLLTSRRTIHQTEDKAQQTTVKRSWTNRSSGYPRQPTRTPNRQSIMRERRFRQRQSGHLEIVKLLLSRQRGGHREVVSVLVAKLAKVNSESSHRSPNL